MPPPPPPRPRQVLQIGPDTEQLVFAGPFNLPVTVALTLRNPGTDPVAFKVKTTAPKAYCVRPSCGLVPGDGAAASVAVTLQPFQFDPSDRPRHKFMVQSLLVAKDTVAMAAAAAADASDAAAIVDALWSSAKSADLMSSRLTVVMAPAVTAESPEDSALPQQPPQPLTEKPEQSLKHLMENADQPLHHHLTKNPVQQLVEMLHQVMREQAQQQQQQQLQTNDSNGELNNLQQELQRLKQENAGLCEQELRLRKTAMREIQRRQRSPQQQLPGPQQRNQEAQWQTVKSVCSILLALVAGLVIGKLVLQ